MKSGFDLIRPTRAGTFGTADWMPWRMAQEAGLDEAKQSPFLGVLPYSTNRGMNALPIYANVAGHQITIAPTRTGKGTCHIIPNLMMWPYSVVVLDIKGENHDITQRRRKAFGNVISFSPFRADSATWNPIEEIRVPEDHPDREALEQENVRYLTNLLVTPNPDAKDPYWDNAAKSMIQAFVMWVATTPNLNKESCPKERTMAEVRRLITQSPEDFRASLIMMSGDSERRWVREQSHVIRQMQESKEQFTSVWATASEHLNVWSYDRVARITKKSDFRFRNLRTRPKSIFIIIPPEYMNEYRALLRVMTGWAIRELKETYKGNLHKDHPPVLFMLDEFPQLGRMEPIQEGLAYLAGYGIRLWMFVQNINQLREQYPQNWQIFMANSATRSFFGVTDFETAKLVSEMSGLTTVQNRTVGQTYSETNTTSSSTGSSRGTSSSGFLNPSTTSTGTSSSNTSSFSQSHGSSASVTNVQRNLINPDEIMRMGANEQVIFIQGLPPIRAGKVPYYVQTNWTGMYDQWHGDDGVIEDKSAEQEILPNAFPHKMNCPVSKRVKEIEHDKNKP